MPGVPLDAFDLLEQSFKDIGRGLSLKAHKPLSRHHKHNSEPSVPSATIAHLSSDEDVRSDDGRPSPQTSPNGSRNHRSMPRKSSDTADLREQLDRQNSGLPPTPPTMIHSGIGARRDEEDARQKPQEQRSQELVFADGVRNALESKKSGLSTPVQHPHSPPTPDASPPSTYTSTERLAPPLQPTMLQRPGLPHNPSSYAESFQTAREDATANNSSTEVHLPNDDILPEHWLDSQKTLLNDVHIGNGVVKDDDLPANGMNEQDVMSESSREDQGSESFADEGKIFVTNPEGEKTPTAEKQNPASDWDHYVSFVGSKDVSPAQSSHSSPPVTRDGPVSSSDSRHSDSDDKRNSTRWDITPPELQRSRRSLDTSYVLLNDSSAAEESPIVPRPKQYSTISSDNSPSSNTESATSRRSEKLHSMLPVRTDTLRRKRPDTPPHQREIAKEARAAGRLSSIRKSGGWDFSALESAKHQDARDPTAIAKEAYEAKRYSTMKNGGELDTWAGRDVGRSVDVVRSGKGWRRSDNYDSADDSMEEHADEESGGEDMVPELDSPDARKDLHDESGSKSEELASRPQSTLVQVTSHDSTRQQVLSASDDQSLPNKDETNLAGHEDDLKASPRVSVLIPSQADAGKTSPGVSEAPRTASPQTRTDPPYQSQSPSPEESPTIFAPRTSSKLGGTLRKRENMHPQPRLQRAAAHIDILDATVNNDALYREIQDQNARRISAISNGSAVQATILDNTPTRKRTLRHVSKTKSLRDGGSNSPNSSKRNSVEHEHALRHKKALEPTRGSWLEISPRLEQGKERQEDSAFSHSQAPMARQTITPFKQRMRASFKGPTDGTTSPPPPQLPKLSRTLQQSPNLDGSSPQKLSAAPFQLSREASTINALTSESLDAHNAATANLEAKLARTPDVAKAARLSWYRGDDDGSHDMSKSSPVLRMNKPRVHSLRRFSREERLEKNIAFTRGSLDGSAPTSPTSQHLRHFSREERLERNATLKRNSIDATGEPQSPSSPMSPSSPKLQRFSREERLESLDQIRRISTGPDLAPSADPPPGRARNMSTATGGSRATIDSNQALLPPATSQFTSPRRSDLGNARVISTPFSNSQLSDRSEMEVCEARGVTIYPHKNDSLVVVEQGINPGDIEYTSYDNVLDQAINAAAVRTQSKAMSPALKHHSGMTRQEHFGEPVFSATVEPATPPLGMNTSKNAVDSPLTNPRQAPQPPVIKFIPPTPNREYDDRQLFADGSATVAGRTKRPDAPQRRESLREKARRYSESFVVRPVFGRQSSLRNKQPTRIPSIGEVKPTNLHPFWKPRGFWDDFANDSEDEDMYYDDEDDPLPVDGTLPRGGDTSEHPSMEDDGKVRRGSILPRAMTLRVAGFTGRSASSRARRNVSAPVSMVYDDNDPAATNGVSQNALQQRLSLRHRASDDSLRHLSSQDSLRQLAGGGGAIGRRATVGEAWRGRHGRVFTVPVTGTRLQYVGLRHFREKMNTARLKKEEREAERRRERLRGAIGYRVYHGS